MGRGTVGSGAGRPAMAGRAGIDTDMDDDPGNDDLGDDYLDDGGLEDDNVLSLHRPPRVDGAHTAHEHAPDDSQPDDDAVNPDRAQSERPDRD